MELLRDARQRAGFSQRELARRAGTSQAMVARIERGQQSPSVATLERLVRACGAELQVGLGGEAVAAAPSGAADGKLLVWRCGPDAYAFPLDAVERIVEYTPPRRLPGQPPGSAVAIVDGAVTASLDAAHRLGVQGVVPERIVVIRAHGDRIAVLVDAVEAVTGPAPVSPTPPGARAAAYVAGLATVDGESVAVLDPDGFCGEYGTGIGAGRYAGNCS